MKKYLYITAMTLMFAPAAYANEVTPNTFDHVKAGFAQAIDGISGWFGADNAAISNIEPAAGDAGVSYDETQENLSVPPHVDPSMIEPAAGFDADVLQVPPAYIPPVSNVVPRATAFDYESVAAFGVDEPSVQDLAGIATAAGGEDVACEIEADEKLAVEGETPSISCNGGVVAETVVEEEKSPAQPAFEPMPVTGDLPETRPAAGE